VSKPRNPLIERPGVGDLTASARADLPRSLSPQLATLVKNPPTGDAWLYEAKLDGYRIMARVENGKARLVTRNGNDWTAKMPALAKEIESLPLESAWLDGEIVVMKPNGVPDFNALQNAIDASKGTSVSYFVFDLPYANGYDLTRSPLHARRSLLREAMAKHKGGRVKFSDDFAGDGETLLKAACKMGLEGIIAKRKDSLYEYTRSKNWLKIKCTQRQEFVVVGFVDRANSNKSEVGSLLLGYYEGGKLRFAGSCGTGWDMRTGADLHRRLSKIEIDKHALDRGEMQPRTLVQAKSPCRTLGQG
jgi:bifunctional non-homologous end joining protein LigD